MGHKRILLADANDGFLEKAAEILDGIGVATIVTNHGNAALSALRQERPEAALLNAELPAMPGTEVCQRLKAEDPALPVVLMFAEERDDLPEVARRWGADNYVIRPLKRNELLFCARTLLGLRDLFAERRVGTLISEGDESAKDRQLVSLDLLYRFLGLEVRRADRYGFPLSLLSVRLDPVPETFADSWTKALDAQLGPALADAVCNCLREIDVSSMLPDREVLVLMPHTDEEGARIVAERLRKRISSQPYRFGRTEINPTVSVGVAVVHGSPATAVELLRLSQERCTRAAEAGGNRVLHAD